MVLLCWLLLFIVTWWKWTKMVNWCRVERMRISWSPVVGWRGCTYWYIKETKWRNGNTVWKSLLCTKNFVERRLSRLQRFLVQVVTAVVMHGSQLRCIVTSYFYYVGLWHRLICCRVLLVQYFRIMEIYHLFVAYSLKDYLQTAISHLGTNKKPNFWIHWKWRLKFRVYVQQITSWHDTLGNTNVGPLGMVYGIILWQFWKHLK